MNHDSAATAWITEGLTDLGHFPLVIAGGGAAGTAAAITAGRLGVRSLLIEPLSFLGGTGVASQVTPWMSNAIDMGPLNEGLSAELQRELEAAGQAHGYSINPEALKGRLERKCVEAGVTLLYHASVVAVQRNGTRLVSLALATRAGLRRVSADVFIDASGDAHVAALAGVPCRSGRESDGVHQPMSLRFVLGGIDLAALESFCSEQGGPNTVHRGSGKLTNGPGAMFLKEYAAADNWPERWQKTFSIQFFEIPGRPGELWFNCPRITGHDPLDPFSLSAAYVEGRRMIDAYLELFRRHVRGAEQAYLVMVAPLMGIREGRRIVGRYTLTGDDFLARRKFADGICLNRYPIDIHNPHGQGLAEWTEMPAGLWHEIPFRCLVPAGVDNMLVAGRCISSDFSAQASYRIIPNCRTFGEAAGVAVYLAAQAACDVSAVDGVAVRREMVRRGLLPACADSPAAHP
jgi:hypothetical protein